MRSLISRILKLNVIGLLLLSGLFVSASTYFPTFYHHFNPVVGGWSTYEVNDGSGIKTTLTFAIVQKEGDAYWIEMRMPGADGTAIASYLVAGDPADDNSIRMLRAKDVGGQALEMSRETLEELKRQGNEAFGGSAASIGPPVGKLKLLKQETIAVGNRKLDCSHLMIVGAHSEAEVWLNDKVVPFGIVQLKSGDESLTLKDFGDGAKPMLKGPFKEMKVP